MTNANVKRHLQDVGSGWTFVMLEQGNLYHEVGAAVGVQHTVITRALVMYQMFGTPFLCHGVVRRRAITADDESGLRETALRLQLNSICMTFRKILGIST